MHASTGTPPARWATEPEIGQNRVSMATIRRCLVVFTKPSRPGLVKTRLLGELSAERAARLHAVILRDLLERMGDGDFETRLAWAVEAREPLPASPVVGFRQTGEDLGERLFEGLRRTTAEFDLVAAVGSDHPDLPVALVEQAFEKLAAGSDVVLGPAADGGYYLIGITRRSIDRELFSEIDWSTDRVLRQTLDRCQSLGVRVEELMPLQDVDTPEDLRQLAGRLTLGEGPPSPHTRSLLVDWGMIPIQGRTER